MSEHTPTPWKVTGGHYVDAPIGNGRLQEVAYCGDCEVGNQRDNALHIVRCVNSHERLVKSLRAALRCMESDLEQIEGEWGMGRSLERLEKDMELTEEIVEARAILAELDADK